MVTQDERGGWTSASNAAADALCQGRHQAQVGLPDVESEDASHGKVIHAALKAQDPSKLDHEQEKTYDMCMAMERTLVQQFFGEEKVTKVFREERIWLEDIHAKHSAMPDVVYVHNCRALIIEYKTLPGDVPESSSNPQLRDQACLVFGAYLAKEIGVAVAQPLVSMKPELCVYKLPDIVRAKLDMWARVMASNQPFATRTAGEVQCKFCKAKRMCGEYQRWIVPLVPEKIDRSLSTVPVQEWTPVERKVFCESLDKIATAFKWVEDTKDAMRKLLEEDHDSIPGWTLEKGDNRTTITDPTTVFERFLGKGGTPEQFLKAVEVGKGKLEAQLRRVTQLKGKLLTSELNALIEGACVVKQNRPSLKKL